MMAKTVFIVTSEGDDSVGLVGVDGTVIIEDNSKEHDADMIKTFVDAIKIIYEDEIGLVVNQTTETEWCPRCEKFVNPKKHGCYVESKQPTTKIEGFQSEMNQDAQHH